MFELILPASEINHTKMSNNQLWSLQDSLVYTLYKYLSKRDTCRSWSIGLDIRLPSRNKNYSSNYRQRLIKYASHDCLSLMELIRFMYEQYLNHPSRNEDYVQTLGEYFLSLNQKFTSSIPSSSGKNQQQQYDSSFNDSNDDSDDMLTVHELDERQPSSLNRSFIQQPTTSDLSTSQHLKLLDQQSNSQPQVIISPVAVVNQHPHIPPTQRKIKRKPRRSAESQKRRNQKTSKRHQRNRYRFEIQRSTNMDVTTVKDILDEYNIQYKNVNPVRSVIFIGVHSQQHQQLYDQLLPVDIFLRT
jgi:hypothetical protein